MKKRLAIFASGSGTNARNLVEKFRKSTLIEIVFILSNNKYAGVHELIKDLEVDSIVFSKEDMYENGRIISILQDMKIDFIVLGGFLWKLPEAIVDCYRDRIINIHPALLPDYGGKGMYGDNVHKAVVANGERRSGITIHLVNNEYDKGRILFQAVCPIEPGDSYIEVAQKVHDLEYKYFPEVIHDYIEKGSLGLFLDKNIDF